MQKKNDDEKRSIQQHSSLKPGVNWSCQDEGKYLVVIGTPANKEPDKDFQAGNSLWAILCRKFARTSQTPGQVTAK